MYLSSLTNSLSLSHFHIPPFTLMSVFPSYFSSMFCSLPSHSLSCLLFHFSSSKYFFPISVYFPSLSYQFSLLTVSLSTCPLYLLSSLASCLPSLPPCLPSASSLACLISHSCHTCFLYLMSSFSTPRTGLPFPPASHLPRYRSAPPPFPPSLTPAGVLPE